MCVWGTQKSDTFFRLKLDVLNRIEGLEAQSAIHWSYNWGGRPRNNFASKIETAWCYSKGKDFYFDRTNVEVPRKMKVWAHKQKAKEMREEMRQYISLYYGPSAWDEIVGIEAQMRKEQKEAIYAQEEMKEKIITWILGSIIIACAVAIGVAGIYWLGVSQGKW